jgi:tetratricopeptide (TPR) repeat protein
MSDPERGRVPPPSPDQVRAAAAQFERAQQALAIGNFDYAITLLRACCVIEPAILVYRQTLRRTVRAKFKNNQRGTWLAWLWNIRARWRLKTRLRDEEYLAVLEVAEEILVRNPWDPGAQIDLAIAAEELELDDMAIWSLEQAHSSQPKNTSLLQRLALLYEKQGNFHQATALWQQVQKLEPENREADGKLQQLAARETIQRGRYQQVVASGGSGRKVAAETPRETPALTPTPTPEPPRARDAVTILRRKIEKDPHRREHYLALAALYRAAGDLETAHAVLQQGLQPTSFAVELRSELLDLDLEPFRRQMEEVQTHLEAEPKDEELLELRARLRKEINARELDLFQLRVQRAPQDLRNRYEFGVRLLRAGRVEEAIRELQQSCEDAQQRWQSLLFLGHCHRTRNNLPLAIRNFRASLEHMPPDEVNGRKEALFLLASLHAEAGDLTTAVQFGMELSSIDSSFRNISRLLDGWQAARMT